MRSTIAEFAKIGLAAAIMPICFGTAQGQSGNPYATSMDNPFLKKKSPTPAPSASAAAKSAAKVLGAKDQRFLADAGSSFGWEMKTGAAAEKKAQNPKTKEIAARLAGGYSKLAKDLTALGSKKGLALNLESVKAQQISGSNFDQSYLNLVQQDHQQTISVFRNEAQSGEDADIKAWAKRTLPTLEQNLAAAKQASGKS